MGSVSALSALVCAAAIGGGATVEAHADPAVCQVFQDQYVASLRHSGGRAGNVDELNRQLAQAEEAAQSGNCNRFFFFLGPPRSPACPAIMATVGRLQQQLANIGGQRFGLFTSSPDSDRAGLRDALIQNGCSVPQATGGSSRTLCVRVCDGYYFSISYAAPRSRYKIDAAVCQSMYAEAGQAELYVQPSGSDVDQAVAPSGQRYADQPYAFAYRQSYNESCHAELKTGIAALAVRYLNAPPITKDGKDALPMSALDVRLTGGVEDLGLTGNPVETVPAPASSDTDEPMTQPDPNRRGVEDPSLTGSPVETAAPASSGANEPVTQPDPNRPVRFVGHAYDELFDLSRPAKPKPEHKRRVLSTVDTSPASDSSATYPPY